MRVLEARRQERARIEGARRATGGYDQRIHAKTALRRKGRKQQAMSPGRLNLLLFAGIVLLDRRQYRGVFLSPLGSGLQSICERFLEGACRLRPAVKAGDRTISECLGVSDFYSVHLTTYFLPDSEESAGGPTDDLSKYAEYCDRVPGTGKLIFSVTLMEKDARNESVALSFYQYRYGWRPQADQCFAVSAPLKRLCDFGRERRSQGEISAQARLWRGEERRGHHRNADLRRAMIRALQSEQNGFVNMLARLRARRFCRHRRKPVT